MNCPFCAEYVIEVSLYQSKTMNRCPRCMRDMYCKLRLYATEKLIRRQTDNVIGKWVGIPK